MSKKTRQLSYCRRRGRDGTSCSTQTYSKNAVCSGCKEDLEELAEDIAYIKELGIIPDLHNPQLF